MTKLEIGDYVRHADLTLNQYIKFCNQARAAGFNLSLGSPEPRYTNWEYTVLTPTYKQAGSDNKGVCSSAQRNVTHHFNNNNRKDPNVDGPLRDELIAQGWVPPSVTPKEQWLADAIEITNCEALSAEVLYDAMKSGKLESPGPSTKESRQIVLRLCRIDQPSTLQPMHEYHGITVWADIESDHPANDVSVMAYARDRNDKCFSSGLIPRLALVRL